MATYQIRPTAATAVLRADLFSGEVWSRTPQPRTLNEFGMVGSAVIGDTEVDLLIGEIRVGNFFNSTTGVIGPRYDDMIRLGNLMVPAGALLRCIVRDAAATNPLGIAIVLMDWVRR